MWSYRWARMRYELKKQRHMANESLIPKFERGTFVQYASRTCRFPLEVLGTYEEGQRWVKVIDHKGERDEFWEDHLRLMTFWEKLFYYHPTAHHWAIGNQEAWIKLVWLIACMTIGITTFILPAYIPEVYKYIIASAFTFLPIPALVFFEWMNFKGYRI